MFTNRSKTDHLTEVRQLDDALEARLRADLDRIDSQVRTLKVEWLDTLERIERVLGRIAKRAERAGAATPHADEQQHPGLPPLDPISARVMARRNAHHRGNHVPDSVREA